MALVGSIVVGVSVTTQKLIKGLQTAKSSIADFAKSSLGSFAALGTVAGVVATLKKSFDTLDELGASADKIGVGVESLQELQFAASQSDVAVETLQNGLQKMVVNLTNNAKAFEALGLSAGELRNMGATDAFGVIAQQIASIQDPSEQAAAAVKIFGKAGAELLPLLKEGAGGINAFAQAARDRGLIMSSEDVQMVKEANDAMGACAASVESLFHRAAIALAPIMAKTADFFSMSIQGWNLIAKDVAGLFGDLESNADVFKPLSEGEQAIADAKQAIYEQWRAEQMAIKESETAIEKLTAKWALQAETIGMTAQEAEIYKLQVAGASEEQLKGLRETQRLMDQQKANADFAEEQAKKQNDQNKKLMDDLAKIENFKKDIQFEIQTFGMSEQEKALEKLKADGASPAELNEVAKLQDALSLKESLEEMRKAGEDLAEQFKSPAEKFQEAIQELEVLKNSNFIDQETFNRASEDARNKFQQIAPEVRFAGAAQMGSQEAFSTIARAKSFGQNDPMSTLNKTAEEQLVENKKTNELLATIAPKNNDYYSEN